MREKTFRRPSVQEILQINNLDSPKRVTRKYLRSLLEMGEIILAGHNYKQAIKTVESYGGKPKIILFPRNFKSDQEEDNKKIKSLEGLVKIDSKKVLRQISEQQEVPSGLTQRFAKQYRTLPQDLINTAMQEQDIENPPLGFYWMGVNGSARATTWLRSATGSEMEIMRQKGSFKGEVVDSKAYGKNMRVRVKSRTEENKEYEFTLSRLPIFELRDINKFYGWINMSHNSSDPDASYRGLEHDKRVNPLVFWSVPTIAGFYRASHFLRTNLGKKLIRVNPFPIPSEEMINFIDDLRLKSLVVDERGKVGSLDKEEINRIIGAKTILNSYKNNWFHSGKRDLGYLFTPKS